MVKDPWNPQDSEIRAWAYSDEIWPEQDWDLSVCNGEHDSMIHELAENSTCPKRRFFLHALYFLIGDAMHCGSDQRRAVLKDWLCSLPEASQKDVGDWQNEALDVLNGKVDFEYDYWCDPALGRMAGKR